MNPNINIIIMSTNELNRINPNPNIMATNEVS